MNDPESNCPLSRLHAAFQRRLADVLGNGATALAVQDAWIRAMGGPRFSEKIMLQR